MPKRKPTPPKAAGLPLTPILLLVAIVLGVAVLYQYRDRFPQLPQLKLPSREIPKPTPTPTALKQGKEIYSISQASNLKGPRITKLELDPLEPAQGKVQNISVSSSFSSPITKVSVSIKTDRKTRTVELAKSATEGAWSGSWTVDDSLLYTYIMTIVSESGASRSSVEVAIRS